MANHKSAIKRHKQSLKHAARNRAARTRVKTSTSRRNVESRPTSAANSESIRDRRKESGSDGGFGATVRWSESEDGFTPAGISARCAGQSTGRVQRSKNASVYRRFIGLDQ